MITALFVLSKDYFDVKNFYPINLHGAGYNLARIKIWEEQTTNRQVQLYPFCFTKQVANKAAGTLLISGPAFLCASLAGRS